MQCRFAIHFKFYQSDGYTCNNEEADGYCGLYSQFKYLGTNS